MTNYKAYKTKKVTDGILVWEEGYTDLMEEMTPDDKAKFAEFGNNEYRAKNLLSMLEELTNDDKYINANEHNTRGINQYADEIRSKCNKIINENISYELQNLNMDIARSLWLKIKTILIVRPKADMGADYSKEQSKRASKPHKLEESEILRIRTIYAQAKKEGSVYGVIKALAAKYNVHRKTISNVVKDMAKKRIRK